MLLLVICSLIKTAMLIRTVDQTPGLLVIQMLSVPSYRVYEYMHTHALNTVLTHPKHPTSFTNMLLMHFFKLACTCAHTHTHTHTHTHLDKRTQLRFMYFGPPISLSLQFWFPLRSNRLFLWAEGSFPRQQIRSCSERHTLHT